jgi:hypothetical protein
MHRRLSHLGVVALLGLLLVILAIILGVVRRVVVVLRSLVVLGLVLLGEPRGMESAGEGTGGGGCECWQRHASHTDVAGIATGSQGEEG